MLVKGAEDRGAPLRPNAGASRIKFGPRVGMSLLTKTATQPPQISMSDERALPLIHRMLAITAQLP